MFDVHPQYVTDAQGEPCAVVLPADEFRRIMEDLEMLDDIRAYDEAKKAQAESGEDTVPLADIRDEIGSEWVDDGE